MSIKRKRNERQIYFWSGTKKRCSTISSDAKFLTVLCLRCIERRIKRFSLKKETETSGQLNILVSCKGYTTFSVLTHRRTNLMKSLGSSKRALTSKYVGQRELIQPKPLSMDSKCV